MHVIEYIGFVRRTKPIEYIVLSGHTNTIHFKQCIAIHALCIYNFIHYHTCNILYKYNEDEMYYLFRYGHHKCTPSTPSRRYSAKCDSMSTVQVYAESEFLFLIVQKGSGNNYYHNR
jgi:hypothetical protein